MAPWTEKSEPAKGQDNGQEHEQDLNSLLTPEERAELTVLVANITEKMQNHITDTFDASYVSGKSRTSTHSLKPDEKNPNIDQSTPQEETEEEEKARKLREKREKELSAPQIQEMKASALEFFQNWQESVISRIGEVVNSRETAQKQLGEVKAEEVNKSPPPLPARPNGWSDTKNIKSHIDDIEENDDPDAALIELYPPTSTALYSLPKEKRILLLHSMLLLLLSLKHYVPQSRILLLHMASSLHLPLHILTEDEVKMAQTLVEAAKHMSGEDETKLRSNENQTARRWKVGLAGVAGAAIIGITGGLAAPLVAAGIGTVMGGLGLGATAAAGLLGTLAESGIIVGALFGAYGGRMTGKMMDRYAKEVEDFAFLPLRGAKKDWKGAADVPVEDRRLRVTIGISGWLTQKEDTITPWRVLDHESEIFALRWELKALMSLGTSLESVVKSAAWTVAKKEIIARTMFASLMMALWPLGLLKVSKVVDNPFSVAKNRADKAGLVLADAIINKAQGERPVTLIGYSLGARVIYSCLVSLAERKAFGLIESAVLIGAPCPSDASAWRAMKSVVSGRLVNVYSTNDYILAFLYRTSSIQFGVAGLQEAQDTKGVENVDVSSLVSGHLRYQYLVGSILEKIGWEDIDHDEVAKEEETVALLDEEEVKGNAEKGESNDDEVEANRVAQEDKQIQQDIDDDAEADRIVEEVKQKQAQRTLQMETEKLRHA